MIVVTYTSVDRVRDRRKFKTLAGAQNFARGRVGPHPDVCSSYAVSDDGVGKVTVQGATYQEVFPQT